MALAPVVLFVYNRPDHAKATVDALARNPEAPETELFIFSDGPKSDAVAARVEAVRNYIATIPSSGRFKRVEITESAVNQGLARSIIGGVDRVVKESGAVIVLEDDLIVSPDFLDYMNQALKFFESNPLIGSITGYSPPISIPNDYKDSVYLASRSCSLGWATWADRWERTDWEVRDFAAFEKDSAARRRFDECGADRFARLKRQVETDINSWSVRFGYSQFRNGMVTVYSASSRIGYIGADGSGVHEVADWLVQGVPEVAVPFTMSCPAVDPRILGELRRLYSGGFKTRIARYLRNNGFSEFERRIKRMLKKR